MHYSVMFSNKTVQLGDSTEPVEIGEVTARSFADLGKDRPEVMKALLESVTGDNPDAWLSFQKTIQDMKLKQTRLQRQLEDAQSTLMWHEQQKLTPVDSQEQTRVSIQPDAGHINMVLITGFESFNTDLYDNAARRIAKMMPDVSMVVFNDRDIHDRPQQLEAALESASILFASLIVDYEEALWLRERSTHIPTRFVFESALELMSLTQVGTFNMASQGKKSQGAPPAVKKLLSLFGSQREEDRMLGYLSFLKIGPKILRFIPGRGTPLHEAPEGDFLD